MTQQSNSPTPPNWVQQARARGLGPALSTMLEVFEPLAPLGAQMMYVTAPVMGLFIAQEALENLAAALDEPRGIEQLRRQLED